MMQAEDLRPEMMARCKDVCEVLGISQSTAMVLLNAFCWSKETLLEQYMTDADQILKKAGVYHRATQGMQPPRSPSHANSKNHGGACLICLEDDTDQMLAMPCGHAFCTDCWRLFCENAVQEGPACVHTTCPDATCPEVVTEQEMRAALGPTDPALLKYQQYQLRSFVDSNPLTRWCPGPGCERIAVALSAAALEHDSRIATCDVCAPPHAFCLLCGAEPHAPASCQFLVRWAEKCRNESETANWILANTKSCPKCHCRIEKNQGCNHMSCQKCKHEFCWICLGGWQDHGANTGGYYKCNKFDDTTATNADDPAGRAQRELDRYLHFYSRYHAHAEAQRFARQHRHGIDAQDYQMAAQEQLVECRRVLKFTYVFAYYTYAPVATGTASGKSTARQEGPVSHRERFEHHQEMLERFTESLHELTERAQQDRTELVNQTRVVDRFLKNILKYVEDGMEDVV
jgi:ariadne-1